MKYLKHFANEQDAYDYINDFEGSYNFLATVEGSPIVAIIYGESSPAEPAPDEIWYMTSSGDPVPLNAWDYYEDENGNHLTVDSETLAGDHYVVKFSDNIYRIGASACRYSSRLSWIFIPSTISYIGAGACQGITDPLDNVRYIGDKTVQPGLYWPWDAAL